GNPTKAALGFAGSCGTAVDQLERIATDKGEWLQYRFEEKGKPAADLLPEIAMQALNGLPIPKRMRWGSSDAEFVRPVHWLLFLHGNEVVDCTLLDTAAGNQSYGHRFHAPGAITILHPTDYEPELRYRGKVIAGFEARREAIREQVDVTATSLKGHIDIDEALLDEVTALVEWPVPVAGSFEEKYLEVPHEALILTMKKNQKYFHLLDSNGKLLPHFITISNIESSNPLVIRDGNERVIRPRLADAMFFWEQDGKKTLEDRVDSLKTVVFQNKLGTLHDKSERVAALALAIAGQIDGDGELAHRAGMLSRCDLMTEMVYEFPDMQGIMGRYQARRDGEPEELAAAMEEFYLPRFSGDNLPQTKTGIAIALAERLDTVVGIFGINQKPTGEKDPFGLRRATIGILRILKEHRLPLVLNDLLQLAADGLVEKIENEAVITEVRDYMLERLRGIYADEGMQADLFNAVAELEPATLSDFDQRIQAVAAFRDLPEAESLAAANKRIRNIVRKAEEEIPGEIAKRLFKLSQERALAELILKTRKEVEPLLEEKNYSEALKTLAGLRERVDDFFDEVMVMDKNREIRQNRLAILKQLGDMFLEVADISQLQS
ncbi:MAG: glycine--tRNA ligase subunit beta, partial [Chromatiales bacterium]